MPWPGSPPHHITRFTVCPGSSDPFYTVSYYIKWVTTSFDTQYNQDANTCKMLLWNEESDYKLKMVRISDSFHYPDIKFSIRRVSN